MLEAPKVFTEGRYFSGVLAPRGSWKTGIATVGDAGHEICHNPNIMGQVCSESQGTAKLFLNELKQHFERNETLRYFYGDHVLSGSWNKESITSALCTEIRKEPTLEVLGISGALVGRRSDIQWMDDVISQRNSETAAMRTKHVDWYNTSFTPILNPGGEQRIRGTRYFAHDLYNTMMEYYGKDVFLVIPAILNLNGEEKSYWPERFPIEHLLQQRQAKPVAFALGMMNNVKFLLSKLINPDFLRVCQWKDLPPFDEMIFYIGIDPASQMDGTGSYFTSCTAGQHQKTGYIYVIREQATHLATPDQMMRFIIDEYNYVRQQKGVVQTINCENNGFQRVLANMVKCDPKKYGLLPFTQSHTGVGKESSFIAVSKFINMDMVRFTPEVYRLVEDIAAFPDVEYKDRVDAFVRMLEALDTLMSPALALKIDPFGLTRYGAAWI
jgi:hypothetical protein